MKNWVISQRDTGPAKWQGKGEQRVEEMTDNEISFKAQMHRKEPVLGTFLFLPSEDAAEAVARTGVDFVIVDMEHSPKSWQTVSNMIRGSELAGVVPLVRISSIEENSILHALEVGARGIVLPFVETAADVSRAVSAAKYAPLGQRGVCTMSRAAGYGVDRGKFQEIAEAANEGTMLIGQIESQRAVDNLEEILEVSPGLDALIIGRADLATSIGLTGQTGHPRVRELTRHVLERLRTHSSVPYGLAVYGPEECSEWAAYGATVFVYSADVSVLVSGYSRAVTDFRSMFTQIPNSVPSEK
jgi:2-keto-3-deoxy-L-rhamnonate aldolase RhmA